MSNTLKSVIATGLISGIIAVGINLYYRLNPSYINLGNLNQAVQDYSLKAGETAVSSGIDAVNEASRAVEIGNQAIPLILNNWMWFLGGALFALLIILILNWRKL